jgi:glycosyltransferase involved in cell wall biosynthesis
LAKIFSSVLIDTYNHERFIEQAIVSVLEQDFPASEREIIVVDDGSTDRTPEIVKKFEPRVRLLRKKNGGQASAFNAGIPECKGEIIAFLDGDDWWAASKLRAVTEALEGTADAGMVGHGFYQADSDGTVQARVVPERLFRLSARSLSDAREFAHLKAFFGTSRVAYRRAVLERILPVPEELIVEADEFLWTVAICLTDAIVLDQPLFFYRFHEGNLFMVQKGDEHGLRRKYESLASLLQDLPQRMKRLGTSQEIIDALLAPLAVEVGMHRLQLQGGSRWEMLRAERAAYCLSYRETPIGYRIFKYLAFGLTLLVPPQQFFRLKQWYTTTGFRNLRRWIGEPMPAAPVIKHPSAK